MTRSPRTTDPDAQTAAKSYRREWIQHGIVIFVCLTAVGVLTYLAYFGAWSHA